jgi:multidrug resistance protein, MATE family
MSFRPKEFFLLAAPMILSRAGLAAMGIADGVMVARFQASEFAWLSLAEGTFGRLLDVFVAFLIGSLSLAPRLFAQNDAAGARTLWIRTLPAALVLGFAGLLAGCFGSQLLLWMGQSAELTAGASPLMLILAAGFPAALLAISAAVYLEGVGHPQYVAACVVAANLLNLLLNWLLIDGHFGFPAMGARGSAYSTTSVRVALALALVGYAWRLRSTSQVPVVSAELEQAKVSQWRLGLGAAATVAAMAGLASSLMIFAGWLGVLPLAAFAAAWNVVAPAGLAALGLSDAAGIQVASAAGRDGDAGSAPVAWAAMRYALIPIAILAALLAACAAPLAELYTHHVPLRQMLATLIPLAACILLADCVGFVMAASLRAVREAVWPAAIEIGSMLLLVALAVTLALWFGFGVSGLFFASLSAALVRAALLAWRFRFRTRPALHIPTQTADWIPNAE